MQRESCPLIRPLIWARSRLSNGLDVSRLATLGELPFSPQALFVFNKVNSSESPAEKSSDQGLCNEREI